MKLGLSKATQLGHRADDDDASPSRHPGMQSSRDPPHVVPVCLRAGIHRFWFLTLWDFEVKIETMGPGSTAYRGDAEDGPRLNCIPGRRGEWAPAQRRTGETEKEAFKILTNRFPIDLQLIANRFPACECGLD